MILQTQRKVFYSLFSLILCLSFQTNAQSNQPVEVIYKVGDEEDVKVKFKMSSSVENNASAGVNVEIITWVNQKCVGITPSGHFKLEQEVTRMKMTSSFLEKDIVADTDIKLTEQDDKNAYLMQQQIAKIIGTTAIVTLSKMGELISTKFDKSYSTSNQNTMIELNRNMYKVHFPPKPVSTGSTWKQTVNTTIEGLNVQTVANNKIGIIKNGVVNISMRGDIAPNKSEKLTIEDGNVKGDIWIRNNRYSNAVIYYSMNVYSMAGAIKKPMKLKQVISTTYTQK